MAMYRVNATVVVVYAKDFVVDADSEADAKAQVLDLRDVNGPDRVEQDGWEEVNTWVGDDWEFEIIEPDVAVVKQA
jgi:hypothetical protein